MTERLLHASTAKEAKTARRSALLGTHIPLAAANARLADPRPLGLQAKLLVGRSDDPLEWEADRVADEVMRMPDPALSRPSAPNPLSNPGNSLLQRQDAEEEEEKKEGDEEENGLIQTKPLVQGRSSGSTSGLRVAPPIVHEVLHSPGWPLDSATRAFFELRFGMDFSRVRIHDDAKAAEAARAVEAKAFTVGGNIVLGAKNYRSGYQRQRTLIAHELAHVVQQNNHLNIVQRQPRPSPATTRQASSCPVKPFSTIAQYIPPNPAKQQIQQQVPNIDKLIASLLYFDNCSLSELRSKIEQLSNHTGKQLLHIRLNYFSPFFYQYANAPLVYGPGSTCNITSLSMALRAIGVKNNDFTGDRMQIAIIFAYLYLNNKLRPSLSPRKNLARGLIRNTRKALNRGLIRAQPNSQGCSRALSQANSLMKRLRGYKQNNLAVPLKPLILDLDPCIKSLTSAAPANKGMLNAKLADLIHLTIRLKRLSEHENTYDRINKNYQAARQSHFKNTVEKSRTVLSQLALLFFSPTFSLRMPDFLQLVAVYIAGKDHGTPKIYSDPKNLFNCVKYRNKRNRKICTKTVLEDKIEKVQKGHYFPYPEFLNLIAGQFKSPAWLSPKRKVIEKTRIEKPMGFNRTISITTSTAKIVQIQTPLTLTELGRAYKADGLGGNIKYGSRWRGEKAINFQIKQLCKEKCADRNNNSCNVTIWEAIKKAGIKDAPINKMKRNAGNIKNNFLNKGYQVIILRAVGDGLVTKLKKERILKRNKVSHGSLCDPKNLNLQLTKKSQFTGHYLHLINVNQGGIIVNNPGTYGGHARLVKWKLVNDAGYLHRVFVLKARPLVRKAQGSQP